MAAPMCIIPTVQINNAVTSDDDKYFGRRRCGDVSISLNIRSLKLHCLFCELESEELDFFLKHLKNEHLSLLVADSCGLVPEKDGVIGVKQEVFDTNETTASDDTSFIEENEADPLMMLKYESTDDDDYEGGLPLSRIIEVNAKCVNNSNQNNLLTQVEAMERPKAIHTLKLIDHLQEHPTLWNSQLKARYIRSERQEEIEIITKKMQEEFPKVKIDNNYVRLKVNKLKKMYFNFRSVNKLTKNERAFYGKLHFLEGHEPRRYDKKTECELCHMVVTDMSMHIWKCHQENDIPQTCKICEEILASERHLIIHKRSVHRRYECEYCDDVYAARRTLHNHIRRIHTDKPQPPMHPRAKLPSDRTCEYCGRQFGSKQTLNNHKRFVHLQIRPYVCSECGKAFKQKQKLRSHQNSVHLKRREHICNVCSKGFYDRKTLVQHMRLHSDVMNYACKVCEKTFRQAPALHSHMRRHRAGS